MGQPCSDAAKCFFRRPLSGFVVIYRVKAATDAHQRDGRRMDGGLLLQLALFNVSLSAMSTVTHLVYITLTDTKARPTLMNRKTRSSTGLSYIQMRSIPRKLDLAFISEDEFPGGRSYCII